MNPREIGLRAQDIQTGLQDVDLSGPAAGMFNTTLLTGMAERLAVHIRGAEVVDDEERILALADRLGINSLLLPQVVRQLEEAEFISADYTHERVVRIRERVPYFDDLYHRFGELWQSKTPRLEEQASIMLLDELTSSPQSLHQVREQYDIDHERLDVVIRVGHEGGYFDQFESETGEKVIYSPIYWEERPEETFALVMKYGGERIAQASRRVRAYQGMPIPNLGQATTEDDTIVIEAMVAGILPSPEVVSFSGSKRFAFTPYNGQINLSETERPIIQKARAVLACIRYGQHFGSITKIRDPSDIIGALEVRGRVGSHSEIARQYAILVVEGVARITRDVEHPGRYFVELIDTPENRQALKVAADMLAVGEALADRGLDPVARQVLFSGGTYREPGTTRAMEVARRRRQPRYSATALRKELETLIDDVREI
jgi:hypothetical protein